MGNDLVEHIRDAVEAGVIPSPISGESMDSYKLRAAHAGAIVGIAWINERNAQLARAAAEKDSQPEGRPSDVPSDTGTSQ